MESCSLGSRALSPGLWEGGLPQGCYLWRRPRWLACEVSIHSFPDTAVLGASHTDQVVVGARLNGEDKKRGRTYLVAQKWLVHSGRGQCAVSQIKQNPCGTAQP